MIRVDHDTYQLVSGRTVAAFDGIVGINHGGDIFVGYDSELFVEGELRDDPMWTSAERADLADHMIEQWKTFKEYGRGPTH